MKRHYFHFHFQFRDLANVAKTIVRLLSDCHENARKKPSKENTLNIALSVNRRRWKRKWISSATALTAGRQISHCFHPVSTLPFFLTHPPGPYSIIPITTGIFQKNYVANRLFNLFLINKRLSGRS